MPWSNQSGGGGNNGGPWGNSGGNKGGGGPWGGGGGPQRGGGNNGGNPPDFEEILKRGQDHLKTVLPGDGGGLGFKGVLFAILVAVLIWMATGLYRVNEGYVGVPMVFGKVVGQTGPGLNYNWPYPIGSVETPNVQGVRETTIGLQQFSGRSAVSTRDVPEESLMLTGDENIVDVDFKVQWVIQNTPTGVQEFLFNIQNPEGTVKAVAESAMREVVGSSQIDAILTESRTPIQQAVQKLMQETLDNYKSGIQITNVQMQKVDPPAQVIEAFRDVQAARADQERVQNEAQAYANRIVPEARGSAARVSEAAQGYRDKTVAEAKGQADRFTKIYEEYAKSPDVIRQRLYLETMEEVLSKNPKIIIDGNGQQNGVVPYLPLDQLNKRAGGNN
ncbi:FtsH protease activity modulator HflK [Pseudovibrio brasiliensis]|uniref:Protein HflK n=1 Tax=Pseudovibrio brasiliensis TaxID=1898042 RepID=A0ABX8ALP7_9HYPH|nr:FtsH protease activity modulator HflK [Pseudovibrio brasiliensis]QUS54835.1 FtsH protease activity modulator HflK [Pseudovibrio brasiliensis]